MNLKLLSLAVSGILTVGVAASAAAVVTTSPVRQSTDLREFNSVHGQGAIAQNVEEQTNIRVYEKASPAVVTVDTDNLTAAAQLSAPTAWC
jgi:hypothetical protein